MSPRNVSADRGVTVATEATKSKVAGSRRQKKNIRARKRKFKRRQKNDDEDCNSEKLNIMQTQNTSTNISVKTYKMKYKGH